MFISLSRASSATQKRSHPEIDAKASSILIGVKRLYALLLLRNESSKKNAKIYPLIKSLALSYMEKKFEICALCIAYPVISPLHACHHIPFVVDLPN